ncbi:MAG: 4-hydroxy-3-methylbut-2-enyl diphosphate reductase [Tannerellaceae bacterium]
MKTTDVLDKSQGLNLKTILDPNAGFCDGASRAIRLVEAYLKEHDHLYCLGEIVHNEHEVSRLKSMGLEVITPDDLFRIYNSVILFRAHGEPTSSFEIAYRNNNIVIDATCPIVRSLQDQIKASLEKYPTVLLYGKSGHPEVEAIKGITANKVSVFDKVESLDIPKSDLEIQLFSQTTRLSSALSNVAEVLRLKGHVVKVNHTTCKKVENRISSIKRMALEVDVCIFVADVNSSNGKTLFELCKKVNPHTFIISDQTEIKKEWFKEYNTVGITGANSTPLWLLKEVAAYLQSI